MTEQTKNDDANKGEGNKGEGSKTPEAKAAKRTRANESESALADWQQPDYDGPLDGEKAAWRNKHIKRLDDGHTTKPATKAEATK